MATTHLSSKGQVIIPKEIREACHLSVGQELEVSITADGILLKTKMTYPKTSLNELVGCAGYQGETKSLTDMEQAIQTGIVRHWGRHDSD